MQIEFSLTLFHSLIFTINFVNQRNWNRETRKCAAYASKRQLNRQPHTYTSERPTYTYSFGSSYRRFELNLQTSTLNSIFLKNNISSSQQQVWENSVRSIIAIQNVSHTAIIIRENWGCSKDVGSRQHACVVSVLMAKDAILNCYTFSCSLHVQIYKRTHNVWLHHQ